MLITYIAFSQTAGYKERTAVRDFTDRCADYIKLPSLLWGYLLLTSIYQCLHSPSPWTPPQCPVCTVGMFSCPSAKDLHTSCGTHACNMVSALGYAEESLTFPSLTSGTNHHVTHHQYRIPNLVYLYQKMYIVISLKTSKSVHSKLHKYTNQHNCTVSMSEHKPHKYMPHLHTPNRHLHHPHHMPVVHTHTLYVRITNMVQTYGTFHKNVNVYVHMYIRPYLYS